MAKAPTEAEDRPALGVVKLSDRFAGLALGERWYRASGPFDGRDLNGYQRNLDEYVRGADGLRGWAILRTHDGALVSADHPEDSPPPLLPPE